MKNLIKEQVRGTFVIGFIAIYAALRLKLFPASLFVTPMFGEFIPIKLDLMFVYDLMIILWSTYIFFISLALGEDIFQNLEKDAPLRKPLLVFSRHSIEIAHIFFVLGAILILSSAAFIFWPVVSAGVVFYLVKRRIVKKRSRQKIKNKNVLLVPEKISSSKYSGENRDTMLLDAIKRLEDEIKRENLSAMFRDLGVVTLTFGTAVMTISFSFGSLGLVSLFKKFLILGFSFTFAGLLHICSSLVSFEKPRLGWRRAFLRKVKNEPLKFLLAFAGILLMILGTIIAYVIA